MPFEVKRPYRALNGAELKDIMVAKLKQAMDLDATLNLMRSFPLVQYEVTVKLRPFINVGTTAASVKPGPEQIYQIDGQEFMVVEPEALELVDLSPIYGVNGDPQELRREIGAGTVETRKTDTGELVDVRVRDKGPQPPPERISTRGPMLPAAEPTQPARPDAGSLAPPTSDELLDWAGPDGGGKMQERPGYRASDRAVGEAVREGEVPPNAAGRVSIIGSHGFQDHGKRGPVQFGRREK